MSPRRSVTETVALVRANLKRRLGVAGAFWAAAGVGVVMALAWLLAGPTGWQTGTVAPLILDAILVGAAVAAFVWVRPRIRTLLAESGLSRTIEESAGLRRGAVLGSLELERAVPPGTSPALTALATSEAAAELGSEPGTLAGRLGERVDLWSRRGLGGLAVVLPLVVLLGVLQPGRAGQAWTGLARPVRALLGAPLPALVVTPGTVEVQRGAPVEIGVEAQGRPTVTVHWRAEGDVPRQDLAVVEEGRARHLFPSVDRELVYWIEAEDGARSEEFRIGLVDPLLVTDVRLELTFPAHTGRVPEDYAGRVPPLQVPAGTRISVQGSASRPLSTASLERETAPGEDPLLVDLDVAGAAFGRTWVPRQSGRWIWRFEGAAGAIPTVVPEPLELEVVPDLVPVVEITFPAADTALPLTHRQPLAVRASDDYGLARMELVAFRPGQQDQAQVIPIDLGGAPAVLARPLLDLSGWDLVPGDSVLYQVRAVDTSPGAQVGVSRTWVLHVPTVGDLRRSAQGEIEGAFERLEDLARRAREQAQQGMESTSTAQQGRRESLEFGEQEAMQQALEGQRELTSDVEALAQELQALTEALREAGLADGELSEDLQELEELLRQAVSDELTEQMEELAGSLDDADAQQALEDLQRLLENQEEFREQLEASMERFKRAAVEQDFRATTEEAESLARRERALAEQMAEESDPSVRRDQQEALGEEADRLTERMAELQQQLEELGEQAAAERVQGARERAEGSRQSMQQAANASQASEASEQAREAAEAMEEAAQQMADAQQGMEEDLLEQVEQALSQAARDALGLADQQAALREEMRGASRDELAALRADQAAVAEGARNLEQNLAEALRFSPLAAPAVGEMASQATEEANQTAEALDRRSAATSPAAAADRTVQTLNRLAVRSMAASEQVSQAAQQAQEQSGQQMEQQMDDLAQQQSELMEQSQQMMPMQLSQQAMQQQMQQMAQGQQQVASELGDMANQQPSPDQPPMGDLDAMAEEAAAIAQALQEGRLDREMIERQQRLFHKLLDAGRTLRKDEEDDTEERESEEPGEFERGAIEALDADAMGVLRFRMPPAEYLSRLSPAERALVLRYFERLNRTVSPDRPPGAGR